MISFHKEQVFYISVYLEWALMKTPFIKIILDNKAILRITVILSWRFTLFVIIIIINTIAIIISIYNNNIHKSNQNNNMHCCIFFFDNVFYYYSLRNVISQCKCKIIL